MKRPLLLLLAAVALLLPAAPALQAQTPQPAFPFIYYGGYGTFQFTLFANGQAYTPSGSYTEKVTWSVNDTNATISWNTATTLATVSVPKTDTSTSLTLTATCLDPAGNTQTVTYVIPLSAAPIAYSAAIAQQSEVGP